MDSFPRQIFAGSLALAVTLTLAGCGGGDGDGGGGNGGTDPITTGTVAVTVNADGSAKGGVDVQLFAPSATSPTASASTGSNGVATFSGVDEGDWEVGVLVPETFELESGETARKSVSVTAGQTANTSFSLVDVFQGVTVEATENLTFSAASITIDAGTSVRWINVTPGAVLHTVTPDGHSEWTSVDLPELGDLFVHTFDTPGTYQYFCQPHVGQGMTGVVTVE